MRIVGVGREVLATQLLGLVGLLAVLATAISTGWIAALLGVIAAAVLLGTIVMVVRLRRKGMTLWVELDCSAQSPAEMTDDQPATQDADEPEEPAEPAGPAGPHWTETVFPDPDEELYPEKVRTARNERGDDPAEDESSPHWSETSYPDPDQPS